MTSPRIQQLSASLVNRIAAGEVIERPASVVKELVENALDAGATVVQVEVEEGGMGLIRVIDNGRGIDPADLSLAFAQHATSKLRDDEDLFKIATMGFRGEALASIGSVSHARILSRQPEAVAAYEIFNRGGEISDPQQTAGNGGTTLEVRNLFFNTPARRKFLKGASTEFGHISEMVLRLALAWPGSSFRLMHNGRQTMDLPASGPTERLLRAWPDDFQDKRLTIDATDGEIRLWGIIGMPELARPTPKYQYLFLNGRGIRDKFIQHALKEAYRGLTEPGRQPAAVLMLEMPPGDVDVNVHPTKMEVRFKDGGRVHGLVLSAVRERLLGSDLSPHAQPRRGDRPFGAAGENQTPGNGAGEHGSGENAMGFGSQGEGSAGGAMAPEDRPDRRQQLADFFRQGAGGLSAGGLAAGGLISESSGRETDEPRLPIMGPGASTTRPAFPRETFGFSLPAVDRQAQGPGETFGTGDPANDDAAGHASARPASTGSASTGFGSSSDPSAGGISAGGDPTARHWGADQYTRPGQPGSSPAVGSVTTSPTVGYTPTGGLPPGGQADPSGASVDPAQVSVPSQASPAMGDMPGLPAMQLHNSYLVAETPEGMIIIDQHALHERIMFEDLLARITRGNLESQRLLIPLTFPATPAQLDLLEQIQPLLARLGIEATVFGPDTAAVQAFPSFLERLEPASFVQEMLEKGEQDLLDLHPEEMLHEILDMMSCKAAVKAGDPLSPAEITALLSRRDLVERSSNCPHGRPTTLRLSLKDLEKQFKRTGF